MATGFNTQVGSGEYRLQFETDNKEHYLLMQETARRCVDGKIKTNADRIRSMTDEELAKALYQMLDGDVYCTNKPECGKMLNTDDGIPDEWCAQCLLNWLRQTTKEEL